MSTFSYNVQGY